MIGIVLEIVFKTRVRLMLEMMCDAAFRRTHEVARDISVLGMLPREQPEALGSP